MMLVEYDIDPGIIRTRRIVICKKCQERINIVFSESTSDWQVEELLTNRYRWHEIDKYWYCDKCTDMVLTQLTKEVIKDENIYYSE